MRESVIKPNSEKPKFQVSRFTGHISRRSCTDVIWLILVLLVLPSWGFVGYYSTTRTNRNALYEILQPVNATTDFCGEENVTTAACQYFIQKAKEAVDDVSRSWCYLLGGVGVVLLLCWMYALLLRWKPVIVVWACIVEWLTLHIYSLYSLIKSYIENDGIFFYIIADGLALLIIVIMIIFLRKKIRQSLTLIREGSKLVMSIKSSLLLPIWLASIMFVLFLYAGVVALYIYAGDTTSELQCKLIVYALYSVDMFSLLWTWSFVYGWADMIYAGTFSCWYWSSNKKKMPFFTVIKANYRTVRYHLGTIAIGSLIIAVVSLMRCLAEIIDRLTKGVVCGLIGKILRSLCWFIDEFVRVVSKNAYVLCAVHGTTFYKSAKDASDLIIKNAETSIILDKMVDYIFFFNKLLVSISVGVGFYLLQEWDGFYEITKLGKPFFGPAPAIVLGMTAFFITSLFFNAYVMTVNTLYMCYLQDCATNDGSHHKPYLMTANIKKIFKKE